MPTPRDIAREIVTEFIRHGAAGYPEWPDCLTKAITSALEAQEKTIAELRAALAPFANMAKHTGGLRGCVWAAGDDVLRYEHFTVAEEALLSAAPSPEASHEA